MWITVKPQHIATVCSQQLVAIWQGWQQTNTTLLGLITGGLQIPNIGLSVPTVQWNALTEKFDGIFHLILNIKVKCSRYRAGVVQRVGRGIALVFHDRGTRRGWVVNSTPRPHFAPGKDTVPILQKAGWAPGPVWTGGKSRPIGIRSQTVQPLVSRYTDWAARPIRV